MVISRSGGATTRVVVDENCIVPVFCFDTRRLVPVLPLCAGAVRRASSAAEQTRTTRQTAANRSQDWGRDVSRFSYHTAEAHGMNMIMAARLRAVA